MAPGWSWPSGSDKARTHQACRRIDSARGHRHAVEDHDQVILELTVYCLPFTSLACLPVTSMLAIKLAIKIS